MSRILLATMLLFGLARFSAAQDAAPAEESTEAIVAAEGGEPAADQKDEPAEEKPAEPAHEATPEAKAANEAFEALVTEWNGLVEQLKTLQKARDSAQGESRAEFEQQMAEVRKQTTELIGKISEAGVAVFKADPIAYPRVNATLLSISQYHMIGDPHGDGGDQYERALSLARGLIDSGAGDKWPQLYMTGGIAAYCVGELDLAQEYLTKAKEAGLFAGLPQRTGRETPAVKLALDAQDYLENLPTHRKNWDAEQAIRAEEAKADDLPRVKFTTTKGDVVIELFENEAPQSVANFITLVKKGYYDGVTFHRVLPLFMAQGGDPDGTGMGGPGYTIPDEQRAPKARKHFRGSLSMANTGQPNSGGSQFFLTFVPTTFLDGRHAVFGRVIEGMDVAASLKRRDPDGPGPKATPDRILKAEVLRDRGHEYEFEQIPE